MSWNDSKGRRMVAVLLTALTAVTLAAKPAHAGSSKFNPVSDPGSMYNTTVMTGARDFWKAGYTGTGVDVALIDSGIAPVDGLNNAAKVVNGPDLSFESQYSNLRYLDTYGHGTHMAGIIGGRDSGVTSYATDTTHFLGMAPDSRILSLKVADAHGAVDVTQMLAAIDWVVQHRNDNGMNIRVLNLSFGTDGGNNLGYPGSPLAYAAEVAWRKGIVVVIAAGNDGFTSGRLNDPAYDPYVIAVGAQDTKGTVSTTDDTVASFSNKGSGNRYPDLIAPGSHIQSLRDPNSFIDATYSGGRIDSRFFRGSGTSQATAVVSGAAALILQQHPDYTPDQVKALLMATATPIAGMSSQYYGAGMLNLSAALNAPAVPSFTQPWNYSHGTATLAETRGDVILSANGSPLTCECDIFGLPFSTNLWAPASLNELSWVGGSWMGVPYTGNSWTVNALGQTSYSGTVWSRNSWSGLAWTSIDFSRNSWSRNSWSSSSWKSEDLSAGWSRNSWSTAAYN
jgi:serine protease AprX